MDPYENKGTSDAPKILDQFFSDCSGCLSSFINPSILLYPMTARFFYYLYTSIPKSTCELVSLHYNGKWMVT